MSKIKVVHYINQFFAQIGGEEKSRLSCRNSCWGSCRTWFGTDTEF